MRKTINIKILMIMTIIIMFLVTSCKDTVEPVILNSNQKIIKLIYHRGNMLRNDSIIVDTSKIRYKGRVYNPDVGLIHNDTTFVDLEYSNYLLSMVPYDVLWNTQSNLPDTNYKYSEITGYGLTMMNDNNEERKIRFYQKIPEIDSLIEQFEQLSIKLYP